MLFGVHFAAIAGSGPLVGPVLASQWGYFPGFCWIVVGSCLAGGVHDFVVLLASVRQDGKSLPQIARDLLGPVAGIAATVATLLIIVATLAATAKVVVNALNESAWGMFTIVATIPAALLTGFWMNKIRPGRIGEASLIGVSLVVLGVIVGQQFDDSAYRRWLVFSPEQLSIILPVYAAIVSILPVWVLLCPRDYLSSYMKIGVIALLGIGILVAQPTLKMPATDAVHPRRRTDRRPGAAVRVHRDRLRGPVGLPCPDRLRHDAEDAQQRDRTSARSATARCCWKASSR